MPRTRKSAREATTTAALTGEWALLEELRRVPDDHLVEGRVNERARCVICLDVMMHPVTLVPCGHTVCKEDAERLLAAGVNERKCPTCRKTTQSHVPAHQLKQLIAETVRVSCPSEGCRAVFPIDSLETHLNNDCAHARYECVLEDEESTPCGVVVKAPERAAHEATCPHVSLHCTHDGCGVEVVRREFEAHVAACGHREVQCGKCMKVYKDMHAANHKAKECPEEEVACPLCKERMRRRLLQGHMVEPAVQATHMNLMAKDMAELKSTCAELRADNATLKRKAEEQSVVTSELRAQNLELRKRQAPIITMEPEKYIVTVGGHAVTTWEADIDGQDDVESPVFYFAGWPFRVIVYKDDDTPGELAVSLVSEGLGKATPVPDGWEVEWVRADYTLSCPDHRWSVDFSSSEENMNLFSEPYRSGVTLRRGDRKLKAQVVMTKVVVELKEAEAVESVSDAGVDESDRSRSDAGVDESDTSMSEED